jgi:hypothetical protein
MVRIFLGSNRVARDFMELAVGIWCALFPEEEEPESEDGDAEEGDGADCDAGDCAAGECGAGLSGSGRGGCRGWTGRG